MHIVQYPHPALRWKSTPIARINAELSDIVREMFELMYASEGIGLAANQVGLPYRLFVMNLTAKREESDQEHVFINPEIVRRKGTQEAEEGCLSLPKMYAPIRRASEIVVESFDLDGHGFELKIDDLGSRAIQHETDHLDGVLFIDRLSETGQREISGKLGDFEAQFRRQQELGVVPPDAEIAAGLQRLAAGQAQSGAA
ncbi:MAG: peptide deformylase [Planctomycetaceae bacterium]|nr:peptide deformylase [Planctomycetaceae bacterium]